MTVRLRGQIYYTDFMIDGRRYRLPTGTGSKREAQRIEANLRIKVKAGLNNKDELVIAHKEKVKPVKAPQPPQTTLKEAFNKALVTHWKDSKSYSTVVINAQIVMDILGANTPLTKIKELEISKLVNKLKARGRSDATVNRKLSCLQTVLTLAHDIWHVIDKVPSFKGLKKKEPPKRFFVFSKELQQQFIDTLRGSTWKHAEHVADLIIVLVDTGARLGEILKLDYQDIDFQQELIHIWENKADHPRSIPMTAKVKTVLEKRHIYGMKPFVMLTHGNIEHCWKTVRTALGLADNKQCVLHAFRHTTASRLIRSGESLFVVQQFLGHKDSKTTQRYAHLAPENLRRAIKKLEEF